MDRGEFYEKLLSVADDRDAVFRSLQQFPIDVVADLLNSIPEEYSKLRAVLPSMAPEEVQIKWTGAAGYPLLLQSCAFVRAVENGYRRFNGRGLDGLKILDYGCGWGRLIRLMYKFTSPENIYGCDPWDVSIDLCRGSSIAANLAVSDYLPTSLPFGGTKFDLIYAFSVFTHTSERATTAALAACRDSISDNGMMVITVRPLSYWEHHNAARGAIDLEQTRSDHLGRGYAFIPHSREPVDGDITYGDTSISLQYMRSQWPDWEVAGIDYILQDAYQMLVFLRPR